jgi:hypothetical protein
MHLGQGRHKHHGHFLVGGALLLLAGAGAVMLLWNAVLPGLLAVRAVTFWQALGLLVLARLLLGRWTGPFRPRAAGRCCAGDGNADAAPPAPAVST